MFEKTFSILIHRPPSVVFAYATDPDAIPDWNPSVLTVRLEPPGDLKLGSKIFEEVRVPLRTIEGHFDVVDYEPGKRAVYRVETSFINEETTYRVEPQDDATRLILVVKGEPKGIWRLFEPILVRSAPRQRQKMLETIKQRLETQAEAPAS